MRLINASTFVLEDFHASENRPPYAILSHRWVDGEEVSFQDLQGAHRRWMPGWAKIQFCCRQALSEGLKYAWVDTCCIDKSSSAELSEAINSMYDWYAGAEVCFAYLSDVTANSSESSPDWPHITGSSWFTRAWTLQELLAPCRVVFYDKHFSPLVTKQDIAENAYRLLRIPMEVLKDPGTITLYPVAVRMSWAAHRQATRVEDIAYSLFGIFQVHLPLLYGEGDRAFVRLQEEIIKQSHDHSIFAWNAEGIEPVRLGDSSVLPLLAPTIARYKTLGHLETEEDDHEIKAYSITNIGLAIELRIKPYLLGTYVALLDCGHTGTRKAILLARESIQTSRYYRVTVNGQSLVNTRDASDFEWRKMHIVLSPAIEYRRKIKEAGWKETKTAITTIWLSSSLTRDIATG